MPSSTSAYQLLNKQTKPTIYPPKRARLKIAASKTALTVLKKFVDAESARTMNEHNSKKC